MTSGVMQGDYLSLLLVSIFLSDITDHFKKSNIERVKLKSKQSVLLLLHADDMMLLQTPIQIVIENQLCYIYTVKKIFKDDIQRKCGTLQWQGNNSFDQVSDVSVASRSDSFEIRIPDIKKYNLYKVYFGSFYIRKKH